MCRHDLTVAQREEYIQAVLCLQKKPPKADKTKYPGVMSRYDDFVLTHETQAMHLHSTVSRTYNLLTTSSENKISRISSLLIVCIYGRTRRHFVRNVVILDTSP